MQTVARRHGVIRPALPSVYDNFNRANSTTSLGVATTGQTWTAQAGTWGISSNQAYLVTATSQSIATVPSTSGDGDLSVRITLSSTTNRADVGFVFRFSSTSNYMVVAFTKDTSPLNAVRVFKNVSGAFTQIGSNMMVGALVNGTTYTARAVYAGTSLNFYVDGTNILSTTATTGLESNTGIGIRVNNAGGGGDDTGSRLDEFTRV